MSSDVLWGLVLVLCSCLLCIANAYLEDDGTQAVQEGGADLGISGIVCIQSPTLINPTCRSNFTFMMLFKQNSTEQIEQTIKCYLRGYFPEGWNYEQKILWYKQQTDD